MPTYTLTMTRGLFSPQASRQLADFSHYMFCISQMILLLIIQLCVFSSTVFAIWNSHRRAAGVYAGGAWQEQSSPGGTEDYRVDRSTPGLKRPGQICKKWQKNT